MQDSIFCPILHAPPFLRPQDIWVGVICRDVLEYPCDGPCICGNRVLSGRDVLIMQCGLWFGDRCLECRLSSISIFDSFMYSTSISSGVVCRSLGIHTNASGYGPIHGLSLQESRTCQCVQSVWHRRDYLWCGAVRDISNQVYLLEEAVVVHGYSIALNNSHTVQSIAQHLPDLHSFYPPMWIRAVLVLHLN